MKRRVSLFVCLICLVSLCACTGQPSAPSTLASAEAADTASSTAQQTDSSTAASKEPEQKQTQSQTPASASTASAVENTTVPPTAATQPPQPTESVSAVTLSVNCANAVAYGIRDNAAYAQIIPADGVLFAAQRVEISDGESALSVLKRVLKSNKIVYSATSSGYIKSIGGLAEFDCGDGSGWLYRVNGELPGVSSKSYKLKAGDTVEFIYSCKQGDV